MKSCARVSCPANSGENIVNNTDGAVSVICRCNDGFAGNLAWNSESLTWGTCSQVACPANSEGHPNCACKAGYTGSLTWNGKGYDGSCSESSTVGEWKSISLLNKTISCHRIAGAATTAAVPVADGSSIEFVFGGADASDNLIRCDLRLDQEFSKLSGSYSSEPLSGEIQNRNQTVSWGLVDPSSHFVAMGTNYNIIDAGMESGSYPITQTVSRVIPIKETSVTPTDTIRFELSQASGVSVKIADLNLSVYTMATQVVKCVKTETTAS